jgi:hypothetical protein
LAFFAFLAFFAVFFFAFLAIASSFGLMDGNATPRPARGGLASQQPHLSSEQIRWLVSRGVTPVSSRYPQLCCIFMRFRRAIVIARREAARRLTVNDP